MTVDQLDEHVTSNSAEVQGRDTDGGEGRAHEACGGNIVDAGEGHVARDTQAFLPKRGDHADRHRVVSREHRGGRGSPPKKLGSRGVPAVMTEVRPGDQGLVEADPRFLEGLTVPVAAGSHAEKPVGDRSSRRRFGGAPA